MGTSKTPKFIRAALLTMSSLCAGLLLSSQPSVAADEFSAAVSNDAPGMVHLEWPTGVDTQAHRITWWTSDGSFESPTGQAIRSVDWPPPSTSAMTLTGLSTGDYTIRLEATNDRFTSNFRWSTVDEPVDVSVVGASAPATACPTTVEVFGETADVIFCADVTNLGDFDGIDLQLEWISTETGGTLAYDPDTEGRLLAVVQSGYARPRSDAGLDRAEPYGTQPWYRARLSIIDFSGTATSRWWTQEGFTQLDNGATFRSATDLLVPDAETNNGLPPVIEVTLDADGVLLAGSILKDVDGASEALDPRSFFNGGDIASPCVEIFTQVGDTWPWNMSVCANGGNADDPRDGGFTRGRTDSGPGDWMIRLPEGLYRIRVNDRTSFEISDGTLESPVRFAAEWFSTGADRAENLETSAVIDTTDGQDRDNIDVTLRDAKQLSVVVTDVPEGFRDYANVVVTDEWGNWFGGAALLDEEAATWTTRFSGLVEGRPYKIFLYFSGSDGYRWWLIGGGTLELADGIIPSSDVVTESWQPMPYAVAVVDQYGTPWGDGEACFTLVATTGDADEVDASSCTTTLDGTAGVVVLQRVEAGEYSIIGWLRDPDSDDVIGDPISLGMISVSAEQVEGPLEALASGINDVSQLADGIALDQPYDESWVVVIPNTDASPPEETPESDTATFSYVATMHLPDGTPLADDAGCIVFFNPTNDEEVESGCTETAEGYEGFVFINDIPAGTYDVVPIIFSDGRPRAVGISLTISTEDWEAWTFAPNYGIGIADITNLNSDVSLQLPYLVNTAVVIPEIES